MERGELEGWQEDLKRLSGVLANPNVRALLETPRLSLKEKLGLLETVLKEGEGGAVNPLLLNLAGLLISQGRLGLVDDIAQEYRSLLLKHRGIEEAEVVTAVPLEEDEKEALRQRLSQMLGKKMELDFRVRPEILGGIIVRSREWVLEGSALGMLESLRKTLVEAGR